LPTEYLTLNCHGIGVCFDKQWDGGGSHFGGDYVTFLRSKGFQKTRRVFEWCAGPGFIGFHLLGSGLCDSLCLADINPESLRCARETVRRNRLENRVTIYEADCTNGIPATERWDLVVGNPPHYGGESKLLLGMHEIIYQDPSWRIHRRFLSEAGRYLVEGASVILQENYNFSRQSTFADLAKECGFHVRSSSPIPAHSEIYYLWLARSEAEAVHSTRGRWEFPYGHSGSLEEQHYLQEYGYLVGGVDPKPRLNRLQELIDYRLPFIEATYRRRPSCVVIMPGSALALEVEDTGDSWSIAFGQNGTVQLRAGVHGAETTIRAREKVFLDLFERRILPLSAVGNGLLRVTGKYWLGLQFAILLCTPFLALSTQDWGRYWDVDAAA
jgi:hypothetical protein